MNTEIEYIKDVPAGFPEIFGKGVVVDVSHANRKVTKEKATDSGIVYELKNDENADSQSEKLAYDGFVVAHGPDCTRVKVGSKVVLPVGTQSMVNFRYHSMPKNRMFARVLEDNLFGIFKE